MKFLRILLLLVATVIYGIPTWAQAPNSIHYQAAARDGSGNALDNASIDVRYSIHEGNANGTIVFQETHSKTTNQFGIFSLNIGTGTLISGNFSSINWGSNTYFVQVEIDNGGGFVDMGTTQFVSVPYALHAKTVENDNVIDNDSDPTNEIQSLSISGSDLSISNGNTVLLPTGVTYTAGTGIDINVSNVISNTGDTDATDDLTTSSTAGGDLSGTFDNLVIKNGAVGNSQIANGAVTGSKIANSTITANKLNNMGASSGEILKWNGSAWVPSSDNSGSSIWNLSGNDINYTAGDVLIGTTSSDGKLTINHNSSLTNPHIALHENGNDYARVNFDNNNGSNYWTIAAYIANSNENDRLNFWNGSGGDLLSLTGDGRLGLNVGISPKTSLHVGNGHRVLFGIDTLGNGDKLMWLPDLHAFRVGTVATGAASTYWNRDSIGLYSYASGLNTRAQGFGATASGRDTEASNSYAFASGFFSNADGQYSTAMGFNTDAEALGSTALGYSTDAEQNYSFAAGYFAEAQAIYSVAIGNAVRAQSYASMAVGRYNVGGGSSTSWLTSDPIFEIGIGTGPSTRANAVTVRKNGNVGIGTTVPLDKLHVNGRVRLQTVEYIEDGGTSEISARGDIRPSSNNIYDLGTSSFRWDDVYATNGTINTSDRRDKTKIKDLKYGLNEIMELRPVSYEWKGNREKGTKIGLVAQEVREIISEVVVDKESYVTEDTEEVKYKEAERLGIYYSDLIPLLIKGMQEQQELINDMQMEIDELKQNQNNK